MIAPLPNTFKRGVSAIGVACLGLALASLPPLAGSSTGSELNLCRYKRTFTEDFNSLSVSAWNAVTSRWIAHTPWNGDFGDARFIDPREGHPFTIKNGILQIEARKHGNGKWTSGLLASADPTTAGFTQMYGYFEARMKLPPGPGTWPAFWLAESAERNDPDPTVEIDVIEYYGKFPSTFHNGWIVWNRKPPSINRSKDNVLSVPENSLLDDFHTFGVDVDREWIVYYLDRKEVGRAPTPPEHKKPFLVLVNLALGSGWPIDQTPSPSVLLVDYIHVYDRNPEDAKSHCEATFIP